MAHCQYRPCIFESKELQRHHFVTIQVGQHPLCWDSHPGPINIRVLLLDTAAYLLPMVGNKQTDRLL
jgi:hypothetical protein